MSKYQYVIIGGGIAGVSCAESISQLCPEHPILLLTASSLIKTVTNVRKITRHLEDFNVEERPMFELKAQCPNVVVIQSEVKYIDCENKTVTVTNDEKFIYVKLCICTGASPKIIAKNHPFILGIRDMDTVQEFQKRLKSARRIIVVGNGGIATELAYEVENCDIIWAVKDSSISHVFLDKGAAEFLLPSLVSADKVPSAVKRAKYRLDDEAVNASTSKNTCCGTALGPDWHYSIDLHGSTKQTRRVHVEYEVEVKAIFLREEMTHDLAEHLQASNNVDNGLNEPEVETWNIYVQLTNGQIYGCDYIVSATGVVPNVPQFLNLTPNIAEDGGIRVSKNMQTSVEDVFAAGDVCTASWPYAAHWMQMRLWSQARQMGAYAAHCMVADRKTDEITMDFCFELFEHVTCFFGYKVVLLGQFNAQDLGTDYELLLRVTKGKEYVKVVMQNGRMQGAILIGDTDLEETFENLILNQTDLSAYGADLLDSGVDIEDYFD